MRRLFGRDTSRVNVRPTPFLQTGPSTGGAWQSSAPPAPSARQTWAPVDTVANHSDIHELVHRIRFLASMGSEDRPLVLDMCDRASTDAAAREAVRALMHEFKHGTADAQLSAARLWAILLRNSSAAFIAQSASADFLDAVAELLVSPRTSPIVRHRVFRVLGDAVWNNPSKEPFRRLWRSVKPPEEPDEGSPYNAHDAVLRPAAMGTTTARVPNRLAAPLPPQTSVTMADARFPPPRTHAQQQLQESSWDAPPPSYEFATGTSSPTPLRSSWVYAPARRLSGSLAPVRRRSDSAGHLSYANTEDFILDISPVHSPTTEAEEVWSTSANPSGSMVRTETESDSASASASSGMWSTMGSPRSSGSARRSRSRVLHQSWHNYIVPATSDSIVLNIQQPPPPPPPAQAAPVEEWRAGIQNQDYRDEAQEEENVLLLTPPKPVKPLRVPRLRPAPPQPQFGPGSSTPVARRRQPIPPIAQTPVRRMPLVQTENHNHAVRGKPDAGIMIPATMPASSASSNSENSKQSKAIYANTLFYLKDVAWNEDESASLIKLSSFSKAISKLTPLSSLVFALQYKQMLIQTSADLHVSEHPKLKAALEEDHNNIADRLLSVLYSPTEEQAVLALEDDAAQSFLDIIQFTLDHALLHKRDANSRARRLISKLARAADKLPSALIISGVEQRDEHATFCGGFGDVFRAMYQGKPVALKHMRRFQGSDQRDIRKQFCREALVWQRLRHPFVVPLIGIDMESFPTSLCMVSPWMQNGTVINYLKGFHGANRRVVIDRLIREIAQGLAFLHDQNVVHGDLRGSNILVDDAGHACLTDFGLTVLSDATTQTHHGAGSVRWMAPETLNPTGCGLDKFGRTTASDIYAFACVCLELYTGFPPFHEEILHDAPVIYQVMQGARPTRPAGAIIPDHVWEIMQQSWSHNYADRPTILGIVLELAMHERVEALPEDNDSEADCEMLEPEYDESLNNEAMSISSGHGDTEYNGWVSTVIEPLDEFIDRHVNPRQLFHRLRKIAEGSSGSVVYEARLGDDDDMDTHPAAPSFVAIKSVPIVPGPGGVNAKMGEILRNVKLMQRIPPSEHILRLDALYVDSVDDALWIQMGFMNRSLASVISLIERGLRLSDRVIAGCAKDILTALEHLRTCDIAVANLSSRNIFINNDGFVKLGNFSAAVELSTDPTDHKRARYISKDARTLGTLVLEMAAGSRLPSDVPAPKLHDFVQLCFDSQSDYSQLLDSPFIRDACLRSSLTQLLGHCTMLEIQHHG